MKLKSLLLQTTPLLEITPPTYKFIPTIDVDNIYAYRNHGLLQFIYCTIRDYIKGNNELAKQRYAVVSREKKDPFFNLSMVYSMHKKKGITPLFFFHCGTFGRYDKRTIYPSLSYLEQRKKIAKEEVVGLHPSYHTSRHPTLLKIEKFLMIWNKKNTFRPSRFHYLRFKVPESYELLEKEGFTSDWSLCYSTQPGFRASTSHPFHFYNLNKDECSQLMIYPTSIMDKTLKSDLKLSPEESLIYVLSLKKNVEKVGGTLITLFHNEHISDVFAWKGWHKIYDELLSLCNHKEI